MGMLPINAVIEATIGIVARSSAKLRVWWTHNGRDHVQILCPQARG
jgi:hypothetical protein